MSGKKAKKKAEKKVEAVSSVSIPPIPDIKKEEKNLINVPKTLLKKEEWGLLTVLNLLLAGIFPAYFVNILLISFFTEIGHLFTTHLTEVERKKLLEFEEEFRKGYDRETEGRYEEAVKIYESLVPKYSSNKKIAKIAVDRIEYVEKTFLNGKK